MKAEYRMLLRDGGTTSWTSVDLPDFDFHNIDKVAPIWDFISHFYNGYYNSGDVAYSNMLASYFDGNISLKELRKDHPEIKSTAHAKKEQDRVDKFLMKQAMSDFVDMVIRGEIQFKMKENNAI